MPELDDHLTLMKQKRAELATQIASLHDGHRKTNLQAMLRDIDAQIERITIPRPVASGKAKAPFVAGMDKKANR